ncbi:amino acid ABC transporter permease [Cypionkella sp.]|uniref:amino acid ABC transporter permease n=1 Tax=Cypionkella sp. TaxID=2811411 RepID=UPI002AB8234B|nr:amino acid ABC transporter permease [Cypionkella sp.]MDZ4393302.1 amino acid ABC transporter permease [Cypionkella sp.]
MSVSYIRKDILAPQAPPVSQSGVIRWVRENLLSGPFNTILTLLAILALYQLVALSWPWLSNGVWSGANSMADCRAIVAANSGPDATGACWAMIRERWPQFIFGFYPPSLWWRPILTFGLLFVALAPVLYADNKRAMSTLCGVVGLLMVLCLIGADGFSSHTAVAVALMVALTAIAATKPRLLLILTLLFPFTALWLLWGGSVWGPIVALLGFLVMALVYSLVAPKLGSVMGASTGFIAACLWWLFLQPHVSEAWQALLPLELLYVSSDKFGGFLLAFVIGVSAISISLPLGILLALGRRSDMFLVKTLSVGFIEFVRGVPLITMLFTASLLLQYFLPPQTNFDLILRVVILVTIFSAAYNAEVVRGGLAALPRGQYEAADALGLDYWQAQRLIIMPQALKIAIPGIVSTFIGLFKDTTLVSFVGLADPLRGITTIVRADINWKGIYWEPYIFVGAIFFIVCFGMSRYSMYLENKLKTDHR